MGSVPHFYSDYQFSPEEFSEITSVMSQENYGVTAPLFASNGAIMSPIFYDNNTNTSNNGGLPCNFTAESSDMLSRVVPVTASFPEVSDMAVPCSLLDCKMGGFNTNNNGIAKIQNFDSGFQYSKAGSCEFGEDYNCCSFLHNFKSVCSDDSADHINWGSIQCNQMAGNIEHNNIKVGRYTVEERKDRILRYLKKRNQRNFNKTIKYACRKTLADRRVRVRGRFARNNELCEDESTAGAKKNDNSLQEKEESYCNDVLEMKNNDDDEDDWLQEAVASLMYVPYIAG